MKMFTRRKLRNSGIVKKFTSAGKIIFHALGDSGASNSGKYPNELRVADQVTLDSGSASEDDRAAFLFHLGDVVYNFGEAQYYYDQFYEPLRNYTAQIYAIPCNHNLFVRHPETDAAGNIPAEFLFPADVLPEAFAASTA
jgi:hypothetical protein